MSFSVYLYIITDPEKKITKTIPTGREITGVLFQDVEDINAPVLELDKSVFQSPTPTVPQFFTCNYAYIPTFGKYYFITGKTIVDNDHPVLYLREDVLKTYQAAITGTTAWIERSASAGSWMLPDGMVPMNAEVDKTEYIPGFTPFSPGSGTSGLPNNWQYVLTCAGSGDAKTVDPLNWCHLYPADSTVRYYALNLGSLRTLAATIGGNDITDWFAGDPKSGVFSVHALPFILNYEASDPLQNIWIGKKETTAKGAWITRQYHTSTSDSIQLAVPSDFRVGTGDYVISVFLPMVGWQKIDPLIAAERRYLKVKYSTNVYNGMGVCTVYLLSTSSSPEADRDIYQTFQYNCAVQIPLTLDTQAEKNRSMMSTLMSSALSLTGAIVSKNPAILASAIGTSAAGIANQMLTPLSYSQLGTVAGGDNSELLPGSVVIQYLKKTSPVLDDNDAKTSFKNIHGLRTDAALQISSLTGYFKCRNWWMDPPTGITETELKEIENHMESGVIK